MVDDIVIKEPGLRKPTMVKRAPPADAALSRAGIPTALSEHVDPDAHRFKTYHATVTPDIVQRSEGVATYWNVAEPVTRLQSFAPVHYDLGKEVPSAAEYTAVLGQLDAMAAALQKYPGSVIRIAGHASQDGDAQYNLALSARRAERTGAQLKTSLEARYPALAGRVTCATEGKGEAGDKRMVTVDCVQVPATITTAMHFGPELDRALAAHRSRPFLVDAGLGDFSQRQFAASNHARASGESLVDIVFERRGAEGPPASPLQLKAVADDPANLRLFVRDGPLKAGRLTTTATDATHLALTLDGHPFAVLEVVGPDGRPRDLGRIQVDMLDPQGHSPRSLATLYAPQFERARVASGQGNGQTTGRVVPQFESTPPMPPTQGLDKGKGSGVSASSYPR